MGHATIVNKTAYAFDALHLVDEELRPLVVPVVKATYLIQPGASCTLANEQIPLNLTGECWGQDPAVSSYKYEPEVAFAKPATDVAVIGHAYAPRRGTCEMRVSIRVGALSKTIHVFGNRVWSKTLGSIAISKPSAFEQIPLTYERAFGGWDRTHADPTKHTCDLRNPVGTGYASAAAADGVSMPNLEDPNALLAHIDDRPAPAGVGFVSPQWQPRAALAGTYDAAWAKSRSPRLPVDFDRRHLNAASQGLIAPGYLRGDEVVALTGMTPDGTLTFKLPAAPAPHVTVSRQDGRAVPVPLALDTVIIEPDERRVLLFWRGGLALQSGPHDVAGIDVSTQPLAS